MYIQIKTFMHAVTSHKMEGRNITLRSHNVSQKQQFRSRGPIASKASSEKKNLTVDTDEQTFTCDNANGNSQTGNRKKLASRITI